MPWIREYNPRNDDDVHVYPLADLREHDTDTRGCWCGPRLDVCPGAACVVIHNSADGREITERAVADASGAGSN